MKVLIKRISVQNGPKDQIAYLLVTGNEDCGMMNVVC